MKREIEEAIRTAVAESDQNESLSRRLVAWFDEVSSGNEMLTERESTDRRLERLYEDTILPEDKMRVKSDAVFSEEWKKKTSEELFGARAGSTGEDGDGRPGSAGSSG